MSIHGESIGRAICADELAAANERIMELEKEEAVMRRNALSWHEAYAAERAISDKLEKILSDIIVWVDDSWVKGSAIKDSAYTVLTEVAAIRAKEQK